MLAPEYLDRCADGVIALYQRFDESIARDIARRLMKMGELTDTARWQAEQLQHAGLLYDDVIAGVAKYSGASETAVRRAFEDAGVESVDAEIAQYLEAGISLPPIRQSERAWNILQAALRKTNGELHNLTLTTAVETQQRFIAACTLAEMQVSSGMLDYQTAIRRAVEDASRAGASVLYPSGHADKLDVAVRRAVLTGVNQTCGQISETLAREFGCDLMELTAHAGARPSHAVWQGQIVSLSGRRGYLSLSDIGYGTGAGFQGYNCRHSWSCFFEGISERSWTPEKLERLNARDIEYGGQKYTAYEISQMQRKMEREIRATKRALSGLDEAGFKAEFAQQAVKLKRQEAQLKAFARETGGRADSFRTQVQGFGRSEAQKAVWANKAELEKYAKIHYHKDGTVVVTDDWKKKSKPSIPKQFKPNAVLETKTEYRNGTIQVDRSFYDADGWLWVQIHSGDHNKPHAHKFGEHGEEPFHKHSYYRTEDGIRRNDQTESLSDQEKRENADILHEVRK